MKRYLVIQPKTVKIQGNCSISGRYHFLSSTFLTVLKMFENKKTIMYHVDCFTSKINFAYGFTIVIATMHWCVPVF